MPYLTPITENGRRKRFYEDIKCIALDSVCSFCGKSARGIRSLDCGIHYICDSCSQIRHIQTVCPLCYRRNQHLISRVGVSTYLYE